MAMARRKVDILRKRSRSKNTMRTLVNPFLNRLHRRQRKTFIVQRWCSAYEGTRRSIAWKTARNDRKFFATWKRSAPHGCKDQKTVNYYSMFRSSIETTHFFIEDIWKLPEKKKFAFKRVLTGYESIVYGSDIENVVGMELHRRAKNENKALRNRSNDSMIVQLCSHHHALPKAHALNDVFFTFIFIKKKTLFWTKKWAVLISTLNMFSHL